MRLHHRLIPAVALVCSHIVTGQASAEGAKPSPQVSHKRGRAPTSPATQLPSNAIPQTEDFAARRAVAGGQPEGYRGRAADPELTALRAAEKALFPETLSGFQPGWSWGRLDPNVQDTGLPPAVEALPSARVAAARDAEWLASLAMPDFPVRLDERVVEYLRFYRDSEKGRAILQVWARKVGRYTGAMVTELSKAGLPRDLVWLSLVESGHNPTIYSPAGAAGLWQFIPSSGRMYGLTVDKWVDERLDPMRSTQAAAKYLGDLYQRFGSWELAMAAYNMGHGGLMRSVLKYNTNDFWKLSSLEAAVPWETALYVPKVFALAIVMNNRRAFGIGDVPPDPAVTFDTIYVKSGASLEDVAKAAGIPLDALRAMNPQYLSGRLPPASGEGEAGARKWAVRVPQSLGRKTTANLVDAPLRNELVPYVVRFGDTVETIAARCRTSAERLAALNEFDAGTALVPGTVVLYPRLPKGQQLAPDREEAVAVLGDAVKLPERQRVFYRSIPGDTLDGVAAALGVSSQELALWNALDPSAKLQSGMALQAFVASDANLSRVRVVAPEQTKILRAGSTPFLNHFEEQQGRRRIAVKARAGDTLAKIGRRYGLSAGMMERINHFSRHQALKVGQEVIVYANVRKQDGREPGPVGRPLAQARPPLPEKLPAEPNL